MAYIYKIAILTFLFSINQTPDCECPRIEDWRNFTIKEFEYSQEVFIADVIWISEDETEFKFIVLEVFKGDLAVGTTITGINARPCGPLVNKKGDWLFFGMLTDLFQINSCGFSVNIEEPWRSLPPLPPSELHLDEEKFMKGWKEEAREVMEEQLTIIRSLKE